VLSPVAHNDAAFAWRPPGSTNTTAPQQPGKTPPGPDRFRPPVVPAHCALVGPWCRRTGLVIAFASHLVV